MIWFNINSTLLKSAGLYLTRNKQSIKRKCEFIPIVCSINEGKNPDFMMGHKWNYRCRYSYQSLQPRTKNGNFDETEEKKNTQKIAKTLKSNPHTLLKVSSAHPSNQFNSSIPLEKQITYGNEQLEKNPTTNENVNKKEFYKAERHQYYLPMSPSPPTLNGNQQKNETLIKNSKSLPKIQAKYPKIASQLEQSKKSVKDLLRKEETRYKSLELNYSKQEMDSNMSNELRNKNEVSEKSLTKSSTLNQPKVLQKLKKVDTQLILGEILPQNSNHSSVTEVKTPTTSSVRIKKLNTLITTDNDFAAIGKMVKNKNVYNKLARPFGKTFRNKAHSNEKNFNQSISKIRKMPSQVNIQTQPDTQAKRSDTGGKIYIKKIYNSRNLKKCMRDSFEIPTIYGNKTEVIPENKMCTNNKIQLHSKCNSRSNAQKANAFVENIEPVNISCYSSPGKNHMRGVRRSKKNFESPQPTPGEIDSVDKIIHDSHMTRNNEIEECEVGHLISNVSHNQIEPSDARMLYNKSIKNKQGSKINTPKNRSFLSENREFSMCKRSMTIKDWFHTRNTTHFE